MVVVTRRQSQSQPTPGPGKRCASQFEEILMAAKAEYFCSGMISNSKRKQGKFGGNLAIDIKPRRTAAYDDANLRPRKRSGLGLTADSIPVTFLSETSIHGVKYIAQEKRHWAERIFWIIAFVLGVLASVYLIYGLLDRYNKTPVIVTFDVNEQNTNSIPFPAVTVCNMNMFARKTVQELRRQVNESGDQDARNKLGIIGGMCNTKKTFYKEKGYAYDEDDEQFNMTDESSFAKPNDTGILDFLMAPCGGLIKMCKFGGRWVDGNTHCGELFKPIVTGYGKCCTFNMLPLPLLFRNQNNGKKLNSSLFDNPMLGSRAREHWNQSELDLWSKWDYDKDDIEVSLNLSRPYSQKRAGRHYGLSFDVALATSMSDFMCPVADSEGFQLTLHSPLEMPHVKEYSSFVHMGKELFVDVSAEVTKADDEIRGFPQEKRKCVFENERKLNVYRPYTRENCIDECIASEVVSKCRCAVLHLPHYKIESGQVNFCLSASEMTCVDSIQAKIQDTMDEACPNCDPLCHEVKYNYQTTIANLKAANRLIRRGPKIGSFNWSLALIHISFVSERTVPKLRKALYGMEDLIASAGGILGLCLGFSVLSLIELIYFFTLRPLCKHCQRRRHLEKETHSADTLIKDVFRSKMRPAWVSPDAAMGNVNI